MSTDWAAWHRGYDVPGSSLSRRLEVVRAQLRKALDDLELAAGEYLRLISMCAGDGRDVLPVLASAGRDTKIHALLVELDERLAARAGESAARLGLRGTQVRVADAGTTDVYLDFAPAHLVLACGVFGNVSAADVERTLATLPSLLLPGGIVIWTRGRSSSGADASAAVRAAFATGGFAERSFTAPADATFSVGVHRLGRSPAGADPLRAGTRMFTFGN